MKKLFAIAALAASIAAAQDPNFATLVSCPLDKTTDETSLPTLTWLQGSTPMLQLRPVKNGRAVNASTNTTARVVFAPSLTASSFAVASNYWPSTNATDYYVQLGIVGTNTATTNGTLTNWTYTVFFDRANDGLTYWSGSGELYVVPSTALGDGLTWTSATNLARVAFQSVTGSPTNNEALVEYIQASAGEDTAARASIVAVGAVASNAVTTNYAGDLSILGHVDLYSDDARPAINYSTYVPSTSAYDIAVFLNKQLTNAGTTAMYGIIDSADINRPGNAQYHSHSTHNKFTGTNGYSEIVGYEYAPAYYSSGNLQYGYGFRSWPRLEAGTVGSYYGFCARDPRLTDGSPPGVVSNNYAFYAGEQLRGVTNWAFYSAGATPSRFGGIALGTNAVVTNWPASDGISAVTATSIAETVVGTWGAGVTVQINGDAQSVNDSPSFTIPTNFTTAAAAGQIATNVVGHGLAGYYVVDYATSVAINPSNGNRQALYLAGTSIVSVAGGGTNQMGSMRLDIWTGTNQHLFTNPVPAGTWSTTAVNTVIYSKPAHATAWTGRVFQW